MGGALCAAELEIKMLGLGVMLSGYGDSAAIFKAALGKTICEVRLDDEDSLRFEFEDGSRIRIFDDGQSCCESRYMRTDDDLSSFSGAKLLGGTVKDAPSETGEYGDEHEVQFLEIQTDRGVFTMASHNEHNGYYGGFAIRVVAE